ALRQRDEAAGTAALRRAAELEPADGPVRLALGDALSRADKDAASAVAEYEAFLQLAGEAAEAARVKKALPVLKRRLVAVGR
ncbi:MAG TPA: hypothetical protein VFO83_00905, partial [Aggregicoccus sp.]|nr:hypothetical protein [Aggregicoccus sp.]